MKVICVPVDLAAEERLNFNNCIKGDLIELCLSDDQFGSLNKAGLFQSINAIAHSNIDDFEDECIHDKERLLSILNSDLLAPVKYPKLISNEVLLLRNLFVEALNRQTGIYFFF